MSILGLKLQLPKGIGQEVEQEVTEQDGRNLRVSGRKMRK